MFAPPGECCYTRGEMFSRDSQQLVSLLRQTYSSMAKLRAPHLPAPLKRLQLTRETRITEYTTQ